MKRPKIYLSGPIRGETDWLGWRVACRATLDSAGVDVIIPGIIGERATPGHPRPGMNYPALDLMLVNRSDGLVANLLNTSLKSIGTACEIAWAYKIGIPIFLAIPNLGGDLFLVQMATIAHPSLEQAVEAVIDYFS